ncbi:O-antigen ligase family protein [Acinetobacter ursingii]|uniref:O-antigen ligase family protein n=1 Tax=Acinetobacter ursingii TaxID=108980 RepID=UPI003008E22F
MQTQCKNIYQLHVVLLNNIYFVLDKINEKVDLGQLFSLKKIYLIFALLPLFYSFFYLDHSEPWRSFSQNFLCFFSLLLLLAFFIRKKIYLPYIIIPILCVSVLPFVQFFLGKIFFFSTAFFGFAFIFSFVMSILIAYNFCRIYNYKAVVSTVSIFFTVVAIGTSIIAILQWLRLDFEFIMPIVGNRMYANIAQPNNMATILLIGFFSIFILYDNYKLNLYIFLSLQLIILFSIVLSQSRTVWISLFLTFFILIANNKKLNKKSTIYLFQFFLLIYFSIWFYLPTLGEILGITQIDSLFDRVSTGYLRIPMWEHMIYAVLQKPWSGYGWYQTQNAQLVGVFLFKNEGYLNSAHNIILDILLWVGLPIGVLILIYFVYILFLLYKSIKNSISLIVFLIVLCIVVHANLEYPLFYAFLLFPFGFFIGLLIGNLHIRAIGIHIYSVQVVFILYFMCLSWIYKEYDQAQSRLGYASGLSETGNLSLTSGNEIFLTQLYARESFLLASPKAKYNIIEINSLKKYIESEPSEYNLLKISQIYYFNGFTDISKKYLEISNALFNKKRTMIDIANPFYLKPKVLIIVTDRKKNEISE